jgi:hypothetical protein
MRTIDELAHKLTDTSKLAVFHLLECLQNGHTIDPLDIGLIGFTIYDLQASEIVKLFDFNLESKKQVKKILSSSTPSSSGTYSLRQVMESYIQAEVKKRVSDELSPQDVMFDFGE